METTTTTSTNNGTGDGGATATAGSSANAQPTSAELHAQAWNQAKGEGTTQTAGERKNATEPVGSDTGKTGGTPSGTQTTEPQQNEPTEIETKDGDKTVKVTLDQARRAIYRDGTLSPEDLKGWSAKRILEAGAKAFTRQAAQDRLGNEYARLRRGESPNGASAPTTADSQAQNAANSQQAQQGQPKAGEQAQGTDNNSAGNGATPDDYRPLIEAIRAEGGDSIANSVAGIVQHQQGQLMQLAQAVENQLSGFRMVAQEMIRERLRSNLLEKYPQVESDDVLDGIMEDMVALGRDRQAVSFKDTLALASQAALGRLGNNEVQTTQRRLIQAGKRNTQPHVGSGVSESTPNSGSEGGQKKTPSQLHKEAMERLKNGQTPDQVRSGLRGR